MISSSLLREARLRAGLTQQELGERAKRGASAIGRWERGEVKPSLETLLELIRAAGFELGVGLTPLDEHDLALIRRCLAKPASVRLQEMVKAVRALRDMTEHAGV